MKTVVSGDVVNGVQQSIDNQLINFVKTQLV